MSTVMAADNLLKQYQVEETSCGPLCQHPQCWASNRRIERGLPRLKDPLQTSWNASEDEGALPTLKVQNLLAESGFGATDDYPTTQLPKHQRSSSAPAVNFDNRPKHKFPYTPYTSPLGVRSTSAQTVPSSIAQGHQPAKARSVEVRELFEVDELNSDWQQTFVPSRVYVWCPSKKAYERQLQRERDPIPEPNEQNDVSKPVTLKDMTDKMVPEAPRDKTKGTKKMKKKPSRITPTGGRPYTHPSRSPPVHRQTKPVNMDDSIAELLTLPRDILMDVLVHIKNSDSLDKRKVQLLLSRLMPLIHFDTNQPLHRSLSPTPLLASGILQNKKMSLLQGGARRNQTEVGAAPGASASARHKHPFYLDDSLISAMTTSTYSALTQQLPMEEGVASDQEMGRFGRMAHQPPLGPISAGVSQKVAQVPQSAQVRNKLTSVSTKSLPPLVPGTKPTKPFDYKAAKSLDLTLGPLPTPDNLSPEKPSTPRSEKASTLYVTLPSVLSPDRTELTTPLQPYGRVSAPVYAERFASQYLHDTPSPIASEDFHPLHAVSPSLSTGVPQAPLGTPATNIHQAYKPLSASYHRPGRSPSPSKQTTGTLQKETTAQDPLNAEALGTIREVHSELPTSYPGTSAMDTSLPTSPVKYGMTPVSTPWGNCTSITAGGNSDAPSRSPVPPVTPQPSATPEPWPVVDERDFMTSPEKPREMAPGQEISMATPMAPPPSPEPQELKNEFEFAVNDMSKSGMTSLTPLVEEGEEEGEGNEEEAEEDWGKMMEATSRTEDIKEDALKNEDIKENVENKIDHEGAFENEDLMVDVGNKMDNMDNTESKDVREEVEESASNVNEGVVKNVDKGTFESEDINKEHQESDSEIKDIKQDSKIKIDQEVASPSEDIREDVEGKRDESERDAGADSPKPAFDDDEIPQSSLEVLSMSNNLNNSAVTAEDVVADEIVPDPSLTSGDLVMPSSLDNEMAKPPIEDELKLQVVQENPGGAEGYSGTAQVESAAPNETKQEHSDEEKSVPELPMTDLVLDVESKEITPEPQECTIENTVPTANHTADCVGQIEGPVSNMDIN
ncbi:uncharacterized protein LOC119734336 isoform X2 [Patiria miniata]|uniref:Uncharacterized protein n=1 Tax=Patiria miniata TaxID=46514 RepID=A0A914AI73_PATMI|nr:uncharacterized protein LOC119734336 isoform X2 [Patiria miniata]